MEKKWCSYCNQEVIPTGKRKNICPHCSRFTAAKKPESDPRTTEFDTGFSGVISPEDLLRLKQLKTAGIIRDQNDVFKTGLHDLEARYLPQGQNAQPKSSPEDKFDESLNELDDLTMKTAIRNAKMQAMNEIRGNPGQKNGTGLDMRQIMEYLFLEKMMDKDKGSDPQLELLKMQLAQRDREMEDLRHRQEMQELINQFKNMNGGQKEVQDKLSSIQTRHEQNMERIRQENQALRDEKNQILIQNLVGQVHQESATRGWTKKIEDVFMEKAMDNLGKQIEKGFSGTAPEKGTGDVIMDVIGKTANALAPAIQAYAASKTSQPAHHNPRPQGRLISAQPTEPEQEEDTPNPPTPTTNYNPTQPPKTDPFSERGGNIISNLKKDPFTTGIDLR